MFYSNAYPNQLHDIRIYNASLSDAQLNARHGYLTRNVLEFAGSQYGQFVETVYLDVGDTLTFECVIDNSLGDCVFFSGETPAEPHAWVDASGFMQIVDVSVTIDGVSVSDNTDVSAYLDGEVHTVEFTSLSNEPISHIGIYNPTSTSEFQGSILSLRINGTEYPLNNGNTLYQVPLGEGLGPELIIDGGFNNGLNDWDTQNAGGTQTVEVQDGVARIISDGGAAFVQQEAIEIGETYAYEFDLVVNSGSCKIQLGDAGDGANVHTFTTSGHKAGVLTNTGLSDYAFFGRNGACDVTFDNISLRKLPSSALLLNNVTESHWGGQPFTILFYSSVTNGGFDADSNWTKGTGWTISDGVATCDGSQVADSNLEQSILTEKGVVVAAGKYLVSYRVSNYSAGNIRARITGNSNVNGTLHSANGTYTEVLDNGTENYTLRMVADSTFAGSVDSISIKPVLELN